MTTLDYYYFFKKKPLSTFLQQPYQRNPLQTPYPNFYKEKNTNIAIETTHPYITSITLFPTLRLQISQETTTSQTLKQTRNP